MERKASPILSLLVFSTFSFAAAASGALFPPGDWYASVEKPSWNPPAWLFGPVWTVLYVLIALAGSLLWGSRAQPFGRAALGAWGVQLVLNAAWSWIFFGRRRMDLALLEMSALLLAIVVAVLLARRVRPLAAVLLLPYLAWVCFAWFLNLTLWRLNA